MKTDQVKVENEVHEYTSMSYFIKIMTESISFIYSAGIKGQKCSRMIVVESKFLPILRSNYRGN
jgi:hypothetical protein